MMNLSSIVGVGEVYRVYAQIYFVKKLLQKHGLKKVFEYPIEPNASVIVDKPWKQLSDPGVKGDLLMTWKAFPNIMKEMLGFKGNHFLFMGTNRYNFGAIIHQYYWLNPEIYLTIQSLEKMVSDSGLKVIESGYYDMPPWFDAPLTPGDTVHLNLSDSLIKRSVYFFERLHFLKLFRSHHIYCLAEREDQVCS